MESVEISKKEVLRYLGHRNQAIDKKMELQIECCMKEIKDVAAVKYVFMTSGINKGKDSISTGDGMLELPGRAISKHLKDAGECILMAATLGNNVDKRIRYYEKIDITKALIFDACASAYIEAVCDSLCGDVEAELLEKGQALTFRFSPGYGDLPISIQKNFLGVLNAEKRIGLTASSSNILMPGKSVTAVMGIVSKICRDDEKSGCTACSNNKECSYKRTEEKNGA
ncbi:MAG: methionine synthase [Clostridiaceae bacterium]